MTKNEVATTDQTQQFNLVTLSGELAEAIAEEMDGLGAIPFDRVKIPSGGGLAFEIPGEDEDSTETITALEGVILEHHPINAYWKEKFSGGNEQPDCSSFDGKEGVVRETGEIRQCKTCPYNQFKSDGLGKACKNIHRCYILREGKPVPIVLALPPTSLKYLRDYIAKSVLLKGYRSWEVVTKITLKKEKSTDGITFSRAAFTFVSRLKEEQIAEARAMAEVIKETTKNVIIDDEDYSTAPASGQTEGPAVQPDEFVQVDPSNNKDIPFNN